MDHGPPGEEGSWSGSVHGGGAAGMLPSHVSMAVITSAPPIDDRRGLWTPTGPHAVRGYRMMAGVPPVVTGHLLQVSLEGAACLPGLSKHPSVGEEVSGGTLGVSAWWGPHSSWCCPPSALPWLPVPGGTAMLCGAVSQGVPSSSTGLLLQWAWSSGLSRCSSAPAAQDGGSSAVGLDRGPPHLSVCPCPGQHVQPCHPALPTWESRGSWAPWVGGCAQTPSDVAMPRSPQQRQPVPSIGSAWHRASRDRALQQHGHGAREEEHAEAHPLRGCRTSPDPMGLPVAGGAG